MNKIKIELDNDQAKTLQQLIETEIRRYRKLIDYWHGIDQAGRESLVAESIQHYEHKTRELDALLNMVYAAQGGAIEPVIKKPFIVGGG